MTNRNVVWICPFQAFDFERHLRRIFGTSNYICQYRLLFFFSFFQWKIDTIINTKRKTFHSITRKEHSHWRREKICVNILQENLQIQILSKRWIIQLNESIRRSVVVPYTFLKSFTYYDPQIITQDKIYFS